MTGRASCMLTVFVVFAVWIVLVWLMCAVHDAGWHRRLLDPRPERECDECASPPDRPTRPTGPYTRIRFCRRRPTRADEAAIAALLNRHRKENP